MTTQTPTVDITHDEHGYACEISLAGIFVKLKSWVTLHMLRHTPQYVSVDLLTHLFEKKELPARTTHMIMLHLQHLLPKMARSGSLGAHVAYGDQLEMKSFDGSIVTITGETAGEFIAMLPQGGHSKEDTVKLTELLYKKLSEAFPEPSQA